MKLLREPDGVVRVLYYVVGSVLGAVAILIMLPVAWALRGLDYVRERL